MVRSYAVPTARVVHAGAGKQAQSHTSREKTMDDADVVVVRQIGRGPSGRSAVVAPTIGGDQSDRATRTIGRTGSARSWITEQKRAYTARSFAIPLKPDDDIWSQEHAAVAQEWEQMLEELAEQEDAESASTTSTDSSGFVHVKASGAPATSAAPRIKSPTLEKKRFLDTSSTYPVRKAAITGGLLAPKARFWECCGCSNRNYLFRAECGRCEFPRDESVQITASRCNVASPPRPVAGAQPLVC